MTTDRVPRRVGGALVAGGAAALMGGPGPLAPDVPLLAHAAEMLAAYQAAVMLAAYQAAVMLVLMSRAPLLDRRAGSDRLVRWHSRSGRVFVVLVLVHAVAALKAWADLRQADPLTALIEVLGMPGPVTATVGTVLFLLTGALSVRAVRRRLSFERWHSVHLLAYVAIVLSFSHQLAGPDLAGHRWGPLAAARRAERVAADSRLVGLVSGAADIATRRCGAGGVADDGAAATQQLGRLAVSRTSAQLPLQVRRRRPSRCRRRVRLRAVRWSGGRW